MIRINKNPQIPVSLQSEYVQDELTRLERKASGGDRIVYSDFNDELYGAQDVRAVLKEDQHGKCAYCESKMNVTSPADIEHFRPKTYSKQDENADDSQYKEVISCLESIISPQSAYYGMFLYQDDIL